MLSRHACKPTTRETRPKRVELTRLARRARSSGSHAALAGMALLLAPVCVAEQPDYRHGISLLHELKYPPDFEHFEYANPDAPKGGEVKLSTTGYIQNFAGVPGTGVPGAQGARPNGRPTDDPFGG